MTSAHKVAFPARCAVNISYEKHLCSQVFPAGIPVEGFFEGMVELFDADLKRKGFDGITLPAGSYELHKINGVRLDINKSLDELGVQDGDTLVLVPRVAGESFEPQYESLSTGLAAMGKWLGRDGGDRMFAPVTPLTAAHTAVAIIAMAVGVVVALTLRARTFTDNPVPAAVSGAVGALLVVGAAVVWWGWRERRDLFSGFGWLAVVLLAVAGACAPPGTLGAAHGVIGLVIVILGAIAIGVMTRKRWQTAAVTAVVTVSGILAAVAVVRMFRPASAQVLAVCVLVGLLILVRMTPLIALWVARVRPPHFGSITGRDLFARREGMPVDTVSPVSEDESEDEDNELTDITARGAAIAASARLVNAVQVGVCVGVSIVLPAAVWGVLTPGRPWAWLALVVAGLVVGIFITQGRGFAAKYQAVALACGAAAAVCAGVVKYAIYEPKDVVSGLLWPAVAIAAFAACGLAAALLVPTVRFRPFIRLTVEWVEVLAFIVLLPAAAALGGLFTWIRH
ncbi:type VII secretion integral membrane protein EccD [Mycobacterium sp. 852002-53434_SCH5985345]|uniref:type VII secretion integral membrane protein EccD n=1 Tax=Mycobacterium sp. 852002-53434_SCH5985345 TaxID=1834107 RepID=UPI0009EE2CDB|nr:type VII secretion integral membrane protein EccD [Mycobacterium sp. 852002-53434_SCH5985345]